MPRCLAIVAYLEQTFDLSSGGQKPNYAAEQTASRRKLLKQFRSRSQSVAECQVFRALAIGRSSVNVGVFTFSITGLRLHFI